MNDHGEASCSSALLAGACAAWACGSQRRRRRQRRQRRRRLRRAEASSSTRSTRPSTTTCKECHQTGKSGAPVFLGASGEASYTAIEGFPGLISAPSISPIVQKGVHSGPALTATQSDLVTQWLKLEITERKLGSDPGAPKNLRAAFTAFGAVHGLRALDAS